MATINHHDEKADWRGEGLFGLYFHCSSSKVRTGTRTGMAGADAEATEGAADWLAQPFACLFVYRIQDLQPGDGPNRLSTPLLACLWIHFLNQGFCLSGDFSLCLFQSHPSSKSMRICLILSTQLKEQGMVVYPSDPSTRETDIHPCGMLVTQSCVL